MTELTQESLETLLLDLMQNMDAMVERYALRPTQLIVPPAILNRLMRRPPLARRRGPRGRRLALKLRARPQLWRMMR